MASLSQSFGDLFGGIEQQNAAAEQAERLRKMQVGPDFENANYENARYLGDFDPAMLDTPEAAQYQTIDEDPKVRGMQMDALQALIDRTSGAADAKMQAAQFGAMDEANQMAKSREGAIRQGMERKGQGGSGLDAVLRAQSAQQGANRARGGMQDAVMAAALEKLAANNGMIQGAGQVRGQDFQRNAANSDIVNRFNQFNTQARNAARAANVNAKNQAGMHNNNARQGNENSRAGMSNQSLNRRDNNAIAKNNAANRRFELESGIADKQSAGTARAIQGGAGLAETAMQAGMAGAGGGMGGMAKQAATGMNADTWKEDDERFA